MLSMSVQSGVRSTLTCPSFPSQKFSCIIPPQDSSFRPNKAGSQHPSILLSIKTKPISRIQKLHASATAEEVAVETPPESPQETILPAVEEIVAKKAQKPKPELVLKFIWMEKNIGLSLDQRIPGYGTVPLSPYFFWPRKDAWEELKATLESKPWISQKKMIILLNQATDIINLWQQSGGNLTS
ncbi:OLC1v1032337C1 [Oldenlandia corymbosa var. corymbosa]|uniref:OLC1v1032337C1 n=1 Tax=Oldenlandia corymbosa var. corymbosa TaxID=529605 RepID=A0AAV1CLJ3_OLDCO|nr:OLC1v1032337C1 [Oldenlandia corymbosa var. corymbosa]